MILYADLETYSTTPIDCGVDRYSDAAEVLLFAWAVDDQEVNVWDVTQGEKMPAQLRECLENPKCLTVWHNGLGFDRVVLRKAMAIELPVARVHDTAVHALSLALPPSLAGLCQALGLDVDQSKDTHGKRLIQLFSKPAPANHTCRRYTSQTHPAEWQHFIDYARQDVQAMRTCFKRMNTWNYRDNYLDAWALAQDTVINERGVQVDTALVRGAIEAVEFDVKRMNQRLAEITNGEVTTGNQRDKMIQYLREHWDLAIDDVRAETVRQLLADDTLCDEVKEILTIRSNVSTTSTAKYQKLLDSVGTDDRLRYAFRFLGASRSGRWCLAEGTLVLVKTVLGEVKEVPIERVELSDLVWDGCEWVEHEGVVFSGEKEVIEHDGVIATAEHVVFISDTESMPLGEVKRLGLSIWRGN